MLLMGRMPACVRRALSHAGDSPAFIPRITRAPYRGQRSASTTSTAIDSSAGAPPSTAGPAVGGGASLAPDAAATSRAMP